MLRLIHSQVNQGGILIDDIDDGLPNKNSTRLGESGDPGAGSLQGSEGRDGYANRPKQPAYIPRVNPLDSSEPGFIDLNETDRVFHSAASGKIAGFETSGQISVVSLVASDLDAPVISAAEIDLPAVGDLQIDGTGFLSVSPDITSVRVFGGGVGDVTLTASQITAVSPGAVGDIQIIIDTTLLGGLVAGDEVEVTADGQTTAAFTIVT